MDNSHQIIYYKNLGIRLVFPPFSVGMKKISMRDQCSIFSKTKLNSPRQMRKIGTIAMNWMVFFHIFVFNPSYYMESFL